MSREKLALCDVCYEKFYGGAATTVICSVCGKLCCPDCVTVTKCLDCV